MFTLLCLNSSRICLDHPRLLFFFFFFNDTATTEIYTLSLHDALPIWVRRGHRPGGQGGPRGAQGVGARDRKSTRLNSSHANISYAVFCLKKKKKKKNTNNKEKKEKDSEHNKAECDSESTAP